MSKPLELTVFPQRGEGYYAKPWVVLSAASVDRRVQAKRLTDVELAAEQWFAVSREAHAEAMGWRSNLAPDWINTNHEEARIARILERFATLPSYDEVTA